MIVKEKTMRELINITDINITESQDPATLPAKEETIARFNKMLNKENLTDEQRAIIEDTKALALRLYDE